MPPKDISKTKKGDMGTHVTDYSVDTHSLDSPSGDKEFSWTNSNFSQYMGYYRKIPELGSAIDAMAKWTVGKGFKADKRTKDILDKIKGWGKDTFNTIIKNSCRVYQIGGDSFAEIITSNEKPIIPDGSNLINLKPLNPDRIRIITDGKGMLKRYEYSIGKNTPPQKFKKEQIFHLPWNRVADEIHGVSIIEKIENIILMRNEAMADMKVVFHRYVKPLWIWKLDTDDTTKIAAFQTKADEVVNSGDNLYIPMGAAEAERVSVPQYSTLDPLPWIQNLTQYFYQATNIPDVILGSAQQTTEASAKILYLAFQQSVEEHQLFLEENIKSQLGLEVNFEFPVSIAADLIKDNAKDGPVNIDKKETQAGIQGNK